MNDATLDGLYILVAEDDPMLGPVLAELLEDEGAEVAGPWVTVRAAALSIKTRAPDAAIMEVDLKDGDAYPLARSLQLLGVPYAFLSANKPSSLPAGIEPVACLIKPASKREVLALARQLLAFR